MTRRTGITLTEVDGEFEGFNVALELGGKKDIFAAGADEGKVTEYAFLLVLGKRRKSRGRNLVGGR